MRAMWKGSISFGLVNIPVRMYTATQEKSLRFTQLHELCHTPIKYDKVCPHCERSVAGEEIIRGYEYNPGQYVVINDQEWDSFVERSTHTIDILRFVDLSEVDPVFFNKTYYLEPAETGGKAYSLLQQALASTDKIAVAKITIRSKVSLAVVRVYQGMLALETIFYPDEIRDEGELDLDIQGKVQEKELTMALSLIASLTEPFQPEHYSDERRLGMLELIEKKIQGQDVVVARGPKEGAPVVDLLAALEASLQAQQHKSSDFPDGVRH